MMLRLGLLARGMSFIIINKAKGWWVVQRDPEGTGNIVTDSLKSGWVPAGMSRIMLLYRC